MRSRFLIYRCEPVGWPTYVQGLRASGIGGTHDRVGLVTGQGGDGQRRWGCRFGAEAVQQEMHQGQSHHRRPMGCWTEVDGALAPRPLSTLAAGIGSRLMPSIISPWSADAIRTETTVGPMAIEIVHSADRPRRRRGLSRPASSRRLKIWWPRQVIVSPWS